MKVKFQDQVKVMLRLSDTAQLIFKVEFEFKFKVKVQVQVQVHGNG